MLAVATSPHLYWITSRAAGTAALLLSSASVGVGLSMGAKLFRGRGPDLRVTHEALSLATMLALAVHGASLVGDGFLRLSVADVTVPLSSSYKTLWTTTGIAGGWLLVLLGLSYYLRTRIGTERWKRLHRFTLLAWALGLIHSLGEGTDAPSTWFLASIAVVSVPAVSLLLVRVAPGLRRRAAARA